MKCVAVIAEYNPFHEGHAWQLRTLKEEHGTDLVLIILSGDFVQRGEAAIADKASRTRMALAGGADLVIELPPAFATGSAEVFARGAVWLAEKAGCADVLAFGAGCPEIDRLEKLAEQLEEEAKLQETLKENLKAGHSYPAAAAAALSRIDPESAELLRDPNNLLAAEYLKALRRFGSRIQPLAIRREGSPHAARELPAEGFASAAAIRSAIQSGQPQNILKNYLPETSLCELSHPVFTDDFSAALSARLLQLAGEGPEAFLSFADSSPELAARLSDLSPFALSFTELTEKLRTKAYTAARVRRFLIHILLDIRKPSQAVLPSSIRILGLRTSSSLPALLKKTAKLPVITKTADADPALLKEYSFAHHLYIQTVYHKTGVLLPDEYRQSPVATKS